MFFITEKIDDIVYRHYMLETSTIPEPKIQTEKQNEPPSAEMNTDFRSTKNTNSGTTQPRLSVTNKKQKSNRNIGIIIEIEKKESQK